jgi:uncharacterized protein (TIGR03066 family)
MNAMRLLVAGVMVCALTFGVRAEENSKLLVGAWEVVKADKETIPVGSVVEFAKDGKMKVVHKAEGGDKTAEGTYTVTGDKFTFTLKVAPDKEVKKTIAIKKLTDTDLSTADEDGKTVDLKRKK